MATITYDSALTVFKGSVGDDTLVFNTTAADLSSATLTSIEILKAGLNTGTTFLVDQADLAKNGSILGSSGTDEVVAHGFSLDLTSTTLSSVEILLAGQSKATTFIVDGTDLAGLSTIDGSSGLDTLVVKAPTINLTTISVGSIETLKAGGSSDTTFVLNTPGGFQSIVGTAKSDTLIFTQTGIDLSATKLTSIETIQASATDSTFVLDQADLASKGSIIAGNGSADTIKAAGTSLDLTSTTLTGIEELKPGTLFGTTYTMTDVQLKDFTLVWGSNNADTLIVKGTDVNLAVVSDVTGIDTVKAGVATATTFTFAKDQLGGVGTLDVSAVVGGAGLDTLTVTDTTFDVSSTSLTSIERLVADAGLSSTQFILDQADLAKGGSVTGSTNGADTLIAAGSTLDLSSTTLTGIEIIKTQFANGSQGTEFTVTGKQFPGLAFGGSGGDDTLIVKGTSVDVTTSTLTSIEVLKAGLATATTFKVDLDQLASDVGDIQTFKGSSGNDTLVVTGTDFRLGDSMLLQSIEILRADSANGTNGTTFSLDQNDLAAKGSIIGNTGASDTILAVGTELDLSSTTLTSIENLKAGNTNGVTFTLTAAQLTVLPPVGGKGADTLAIRGSLLDLTGMSLTSIEGLAAAATTATTFKVDLADLVSGGSVTGNKGIDALTIMGTDFDLSHTAVVGVEKLVAAPVAGTDFTTFTVDQADLAAGGSIMGNAKIFGDVLRAAGTALDLSSTVLTSIETLAAGTTNATVFTVDQADLVKGGQVVGTAKNDTLQTAGTALDLTGTSLSGIEILKAVGSKAATFTVDPGDLASGGSVEGSTASGDALIVKSTDFNLASTSLAGIEVLQAGVAAGTTFTLDQADLTAKIVGGAGSDIVKATGASFDMTGTVLTGIETIQAAAGGTVFRMDQGDLVKFINGGAGTDQIRMDDSVALIDLTSTTLSNIELVFSFNTNGTTFKVDQADLSADFSAGKSSDVLMIHGTSMDLTATQTTFFGKITTDSNLGTTFRISQANLASMSSLATIQGSTKAVDSLVMVGTSFDLTSAVLSSIEKLSVENTGKSQTVLRLDHDDLTALGSAGTISGTSATNDTLLVHNGVMDLTGIKISGFEQLVLDSSSQFLLDQADINSLGAGGAISGSASSLVIHGTSLDLTSTTLSSINLIATDSSKSTTFTVDQADLASGGSVFGGAGAADTLVAHGAGLDLRSTGLNSIEVLKAGNTADTTFTIDQDDLGSLGSVVGNLGSDTLLVNSKFSNVDLGNLTLTGIETIETTTPSGAVALTVGKGVGGATLELGTNNLTDTITFTTAYKVTTTTSDPTIAAHTLSIDNFKDGATKGDVLDLSVLAHGTPVSSTDMTGAIAAANPATLKAALNLAAAGNGSSTSDVVTFQFGGDTYVLVDNSASKTLTADDAVIKLIGTHTLSDAANFVF